MNTPELEKMAAVSAKSQVIGEFIEWLTGPRKVTLSVWGRNDMLMPCHESVERLLAGFFEIDLVKVEREKRMILENIRRSK